MAQLPNTPPQKTAEESKEIMLDKIMQDIFEALAKLNIGLGDKPKPSNADLENPKKLS
jgi:hypothetical protein